jgi:hypothetical protein
VSGRQPAGRSSTARDCGLALNDATRSDNAQQQELTAGLAKFNQDVEGIRFG